MKEKFVNLYRAARVVAVVFVQCLFSERLWLSVFWAFWAYGIIFFLLSPFVVGLVTLFPVLSPWYICLLIWAATSPWVNDWAVSKADES